MDLARHTEFSDKLFVVYTSLLGRFFIDELNSVNLNYLANFATTCVWILPQIQLVILSFDQFFGRAHRYVQYFHFYVT